MRCAFCHDALDPHASACSGCGTHLHADCWDLLRESGCPTLGCQGGFVTRQTRRLRFALDPGEPQLPELLVLQLLVLFATLGLGVGVFVSRSALPLFALGAVTHLVVLPLVGITGDLERHGQGSSWLGATRAYGLTLFLLLAATTFTASLLDLLGWREEQIAPALLGLFAVAPWVIRRLACGLFARRQPALSALR